jgi:hypothetical protein
MNQAKIISPVISDAKKEGSGIHIKPSKEGSFTTWAKKQGFKCADGVPQAAITKGKNSDNPAIRKKAVFADNARKWN